MSMEPTTIGGGRYELSGLLGRGGMAEVRKAQDLRLGRTVAIKRLRTDLASDPSFQARFRREAQSAASLNHPTIVAVYDTGEEQSTDGSGLMLPYIVMEYVEGRTLRDILREGRRILPERALEITGSVLDALDYSHRAGIVHRDIKPANVMLTPAGDIKVMDFGIARAMADASATMTQTAAVVGTAQYLSPEQARGEQVDARSDLYSAGCVLFELLTGRPPFVGDSPVSVAYQHVREQPPAPSTIDPELSPAIDAVTLKALTKPVDERYQSASEMRADLDRALEGQAVHAPDVHGPASLETEHFLPPAPLEVAPTAVTTPVVQGEEPPRRNRTALWVLLLLLLVGLAIAALVVVPKLTANPPVAQAQVPRLYNLTLTQATNRLESVGLAVGKPTYERSDTIKRGQVLRQSVAPGESINKGSTVDLVVSSGKKIAIVPDVTTSNLATALKTLDQLGFKVNQVADSQSTERINEITSQDPRGGTQLPVGAVITVHYSTGFVAVPSVVGESQDAATKTLESQGFKVAPSSVQNDAPAGTVTSQQPVGGMKRPYGYTVVISVSLGPPPTTAPTTPPTTPPTTSTPTESTPTESTPTTPTDTTPTESTAPTITSATETPTTTVTKTTSPLANIGPAGG